MAAFKKYTTIPYSTLVCAFFWSFNLLRSRALERCKPDRGQIRVDPEAVFHSLFHKFCGPCERKPYIPAHPCFDVKLTVPPLSAGLAGVGHASLVVSVTTASCQLDVHSLG